MTSNGASSVRSAAEVFASLNPQTKTAVKGQEEEAQDRFLKLYVTQLKNQDPLNPMDNAQITTQLAQLNTVKGIENLNMTLTKLMESFAGTQAMQAADMIGKDVLVPGSKMSLADGLAVAGVELPEAVQKLMVKIEDSNGLLMRTLELGAQDAGSIAFAWNGLTDAGAQAANGNYRFKVDAVSGGRAANANTLEVGTVAAVVRSGGSFQLDVGGARTVGLSDIRQIL